MYEIANYDDLYKPTDTKGVELVNATYVKLPVKPKGDGLQSLLSYKNGLKIFGIWCLLLEYTTSKSKGSRGRLLNHKDEPATVGEIAKSISLSKNKGLVEYALKVLVELGWLKTTESVRSDCEGDAELVPPKSSVIKSNREKSRGFAPPSLLDIQSFVKEKGYRFVNAESFFNFYESKGWMVGKNKMRDWHKAVAGWEAREKEKHPALSTKPAIVLRSAVCVVDHEHAVDYDLNEHGEPIFLCRKCIRAIGKVHWGKMSLSEIEKAVEAGNRRPPPQGKDKELVQQDKKQVAIAKLTKGLGNKLEGR